MTLLTNEAKQALKLRLAGAKASIKKLPKILEQLSPDNRLRNQYAFYKAHTGRWAGKGAQLQNLKAPRTKEEKALVSQVVKMLEDGAPVPSLDALSLALRPLLTAPKGKKIVLADFKSVENRVLAWESGCDAMLQVYAEGKDPYIDFAARMENVDYSEVTAEMRQQAKPGVLGCGFGLGSGREVRKCRCVCKHQWNVEPKVTEAKCPRCGKTAAPGLVQKTGLWRYAEMMGIDLSQAQAATQVTAFRQTFGDIALFWFALEDCFSACAWDHQDQRIDSDNGCNLLIRWQDPALRIVLPSGRELVYTHAWAREDPRTKKLSMGFEAATNGVWGVHTTYGGRLCENITQAIAADLAMDAMRRIEGDGGLEIIGHTHDEVITLADEKDSTALDRLVAYMSEVDAWAKGLPMAADGYEGKRYSK